MMGKKIKGKLIIIGGAENKENGGEVLEYVAKAIGGNNAKLLIMTTATEHPKKMGDIYKAVFTRLGIIDIQVADIHTRQDANLSQNRDKILNSTGIFFTGGDQLKITSILGGTNTFNALHEALLNGTIIVGTSAGASVVCSTMIVSGDDNAPARKCTLKMAPGLGLLEEALIDQHFDQRGRIGRLLCGVAENPAALGIGIDEDTAICIHSDARLEVIGSNAVTIIDGKSIELSNVSEQKPDEILTITNITMHILSDGFGFDMQNRQVINKIKSEDGSN